MFHADDDTGTSETKLWAVYFCGRRMHSGVDVTEEIGTFWLGLYVSSQVKQCLNHFEQP
jgi:hypothetical protein